MVLLLKFGISYKGNSWDPGRRNKERPFVIQYLQTIIVSMSAVVNLNLHVAILPSVVLHMSCSSKITCRM